MIDAVSLNLLGNVSKIDQGFFDEDLQEWSTDELMDFVKNGLII
jgi:hypothetical protein